MWDVGHGHRPNNTKHDSHTLVYWSYWLIWSYSSTLPPFMWFIAISQYGIPSTWTNNHCVLDSPCHFRTTNPYRFPLSEDGDLVRWQRWERQGFSRDDSGLELSGISMNFWFSRDLGKDFRMRCRCSKLPWALGFSMAFSNGLHAVVFLSV